MCCLLVYCSPTYTTLSVRVLCVCVLQNKIRNYFLSGKIGRNQPECSSLQVKNIHMLCKRYTCTLKSSPARWQLQLDPIKMSAAIEELIHTSYLKNKNEILPGMVHLPGWPYMPCNACFPHYHRMLGQDSCVVQSRLVSNPGNTVWGSSLDFAIV